MSALDTTCNVCPTFCIFLHGCKTLRTFYKNKSYRAVILTNISQLATRCTVRIWTEQVMWRKDVSPFHSLYEGEGKEDKNSGESETSSDVARGGVVAKQQQISWKTLTFHYYETWHQYSI
jgi:hypothetical protein